MPTTIIRAAAAPWVLLPRLLLLLYLLHQLLPMFRLHLLPMFRLQLLLMFRLQRLLLLFQPASLRKIWPTLMSSQERRKKMARYFNYVIFIVNFIFGIKRTKKIKGMQA